MMNAYSIDFTRRTVTISKAFADKAAEYNSFEYKMLTDLQAQGFTVVRRTHASPKNRKPMPTYHRMLSEQFQPLHAQPQATEQNHNRFY